MKYHKKQEKQEKHQHKKIIFTVLLAAVLLFSGCSRKTTEVSAEAENTSAAEASLHETKDLEYIYGIPMDENAGVITENVADIYVSADVKSSRITQALYNQPVSLLQKEEGWAKVKAVDGANGWMKLKFIGSDISSIYGRSYTHRIIVTSREKSIYTNPSGGITQMDAPMGSEFFAFNSYGDAYEVFLPGNKTGWISGSGIMHISLNTRIPVTNAEDFAATALRFKGTSFLLKGMSAMGIDAAGLVYICARINGIDLPRSIEGQLASGTELNPEEAQVGDLLFLAGTGEGEGETATCVGICMGSGNYLYAGKNIGYVALGDINRENAEGKIIAARRIFN